MTSQRLFKGSAAKLRPRRPRENLAQDSAPFSLTQRREQSVTVVFLEREVTVAFTTPRTSIQNKSGCRGANRTGVLSTRVSCFCACWGGRTLMTSFKDSHPTIERPGITPPFTFV